MLVMVAEAYREQSEAERTVRRLGELRKIHERWKARIKSSRGMPL